MTGSYEAAMFEALSLTVGVGLALGAAVLPALIWRHRSTKGC